MAKEYLDKDGLLYFWQKIKNFLDNITSDITSITSKVNYELDNTSFTDLPSNTDLNTIINHGNYSCKSNAVAATFTNCPTSVMFGMKIEHISTSGTGQVRFITIRDFNGDIYVRRNYIYSNANHYTAWKKVTVS